VRREVARRMREEAELASMEELVYRLPFKMKVQSLMEDNKAIDERTKEDVEKMEKEAKLEIEKNFPSYYDEMQRVMFNGISDEEASRPSRVRREYQESEVKAESIIEDLLNQSGASLPTAGDLRRSLTKHRLVVLHSLFKSSDSSREGGTNQITSLTSILPDIANYLREELTHSSRPSVMNISQVQLSPTYNFYHDPLPHEARLVYEPLQKLLSKLAHVVRDYDTPIL
jgi:hypothetical protein